MKPNLIVSRAGGSVKFAVLLFSFLIFCSTRSFAQCWKQVSTTRSNSVALKEDGTLWTWGSGASGQLGIGTTPIFYYQKTPVLVGSAADWAYASTGDQFMAAVKTDGTLWTWGSNSSGQLGIGNTTSQNVPVQVGTASNWSKVWANVNAGLHMVGLRTDGTLWSWGNNNIGQLGIGNTTQQNSPVQVGTDADWAAASPSNSHTVAIKTNGTIWAWGSNQYGQLGIGNTTNQSSPVQVGTDADWTAVDAGGNFTVALKSNGTLWAWGVNSVGQLGTGNTTQQNSPVQVGSDADWIMVKAGGGNVLALKANGTLWAWGNNNSGQLGDGTTTNRLSPAQVGTGNNWVSIASGYATSAAINAGKAIWMWGANNGGQLGINNQTVQFNTVQTWPGTYPPAVPALTAGGGAGSLLVSCEPDNYGYNSYRHPTAITRKLFAIHPEGNTGTFTVIYDSSRNTNTTPLFQSDATGATSLMGRLVTVSYSGTLGAGVRVRFYYNTTDSTNASNALNGWIGANPGSVKQWEWVKYEGDAATMAGTQTSGGFSGTYTQLKPDTSGVENSIPFVEFWNITSFSTFGGLAFANTTNTPLPIALGDFTATLLEQCAAVRLDWSTYQEQNSRDFTIQRSTDGESWTAIATVAAAGNSNVRRNYRYTDATVGGRGTYFYRLRLNDIDGSSKYSAIVSVRADCPGSNGYLIYPNPVKDLLTIQAPSTGGPKVVAVYNAIGQCIAKSTLTPGNVRTVPTAGWSKGLYMVIIKENGKVVRTEKLMKQ